MKSLDEIAEELLQTAKTAKASGTTVLFQDLHKELCLHIAYAEPQSTIEKAMSVHFGDPIAELDGLIPLEQRL